MNGLKTTFLLTLLTLLLVLAGQYLGGTNGALLAFAIAAATNFFSYFYSDKIALAVYGAKPVTREELPRAYDVVQRLTTKAGLPMPKIFVIPSESPNAFATGRNPQHASVAVTHGMRPGKQRLMLTMEVYWEGCFRRRHLRRQCIGSLHAHPAFEQVTRSGELLNSLIYLEMKACGLEHPRDHAQEFMRRVRDVFSERLAEIRARAMVVVGDEDYATPPAMSRTLASGIRGAELHVLPGVRHMSLVESPGAWERVLAFVGRGAQPAASTNV